MTETTIRDACYMTAMETLREIDARQSDCLRVTLLWRSDNNTLVVKVDDTSDPEDPKRNITIDGIPPADAQKAFTHPYGYSRDS